MPAKSPTLKDVAAQAGVSYQTVSKVLNRQAQVSPETRQRILDAVAALGYRPNALARNMRKQRSFMIGYSWEQTPLGQVNHILDQFLTSMVREAEAAGYHLLPFPSHGQGLQVYEDLFETGKVDGFVLSSVNYNDERVRYLLEHHIPFVAFGRSNPDWKFLYVDIDGADGLRQAVEHLVGRGHRKIALIGWPQDSRVGNDRAEGYMKAMQAAGLPVLPEWVFRVPGDYEQGYQAALALMALPPEKRPTAILTLNDTQAIGAIQALWSLNLQPGRDVAVIGFDDAPLVQFLDPPLTTIRQPIAEAGRKCVEMLIDLMEGRVPAEEHVLLKPLLIVRASG
ncbi:MAG TPA: LacI family DNA-binding transcriptional regulator [Anaerolineales bacterium]|nr:LacI family DNA-binding transcriptional regulator [Anaerolineales bacterium]